MDKPANNTFTCDQCQKPLTQHRCPGQRPIVEINQSPMEEHFQFIDDRLIQGKKLYYVLLERAVPDPTRPFNAMRTMKSWTFAYTKAYARKLARRARDEGWTVIDIGFGTKEHISHKFRRL